VRRYLALAAAVVLCANPAYADEVTVWTLKMYGMRRRAGARQGRGRLRAPECFRRAKKGHGHDHAL